MDSKQTLQHLGLKVVDDKPYDYSAIAGKKCYGQLWENPQFTDFEGFLAAAQSAPEALRVDPADQGIDFDGRQFITVDGRYVATVTERFNLVQHREVLMNATEAARQIGLRPVGTIRHNGGRMEGNVVFTGAEESVQLLKDTGENLAVGAKFFNSYAGDRGIGMEAFAIRAICCNYNAWGEDLASVYATHSSGVAVEELERGFQAMIDSALKLPAIIHKAKADIVDRDSVVDLLWGVRFPEAAIMGGKRIKNALVPNLALWEPRTESEGLSRWNLYNAGTAFLTHGSGMNAGSVEYHAGKMAQLLTGDLDRLQYAGLQRREAHEERMAKLALARLGSETPESDESAET